MITIGKGGTGFSKSVQVSQHINLKKQMLTTYILILWQIEKSN